MIAPIFRGRIYQRLEDRWDWDVKKELKEGTNIIAIEKKELKKGTNIIVSEKNDKLQNDELLLKGMIQWLKL